MNLYTIPEITTTDEGPEVYIGAGEEMPTVAPERPITEKD